MPNKKLSINDEPLPPFIAELVLKREQRKDFQESALFAEMVAAFVRNPTPVSLSGEHFLYEPVAAKTTAGLSFASDADVVLFLDVIADPDANTVEAGSLVIDKSCSFSNCQFRHYGLIVWMMFGQGTSVMVGNDAHALAHDATGGLVEPEPLASASYTQTDYDNLRKLALASSTGPWEFRNHNNEPENSAPSDDWSVVNTKGQVICSEPQCTHKRLPDVCDGAYIAAANPALILSLLAELARLRALST